MQRRTFLQRTFGFGVAGLALSAGLPHRALASAAKLVKVVEFTDLGQRKGVMEVEKVVKTDAEWKQELTPEEYEVTRPRARSGPSPAKLGQP